MKYTAYDEADNDAQTRFLPVQDVADLYVFRSLGANSTLYNFLGKNGISVHFFDSYDHYTGSFMAEEYQLAGRVQVAKTGPCTSAKKRFVLARKLVEGVAFNLCKNLRYYQNRGRAVGEVQSDQVELK